MNLKNNDNLIEISWKDIRVNDIMPDGSVVTQIHEKYTAESFEISLLSKINAFKSRESKMVVSEDHIFLVDISKLKRKDREHIFNLYEGAYIPVEEDLILYTDKQLDIETQERIEKALTNKSDEDLESIKEEKDITILFKASEVVKSEPKIYNKDKNLIWLTVLEINSLFKNGYKLMSSDSIIKNVEYIGQRECMCISTNTGKYTTDKISSNNGNLNLKGYDMISHNSVTIRSIIFHCVTHGIKLGLVDLKLTEFTPWKGHANVLGVANTVRETAELLRVARALMYKRNAELAKAGVVDLADYKPSIPTDKIAIFGREFHESEKVIIRDPLNPEDGEKEITVKELFELLK